MSEIAQNLNQIFSKLTRNVKLVAVSKTMPIEDMMEVYKLNHKIFGENKVQEIVKKHQEMPKDIEWHFIGHLQRNKVKLIIPFVHMIHSCDSMRLLEKINEEAKKIDKVINCLLQIHIAEEDTKFGFSKDELLHILTSPEYSSLQNIRICGMMGMASLTNNQIQIEKEFGYIDSLFKAIKENFFKDQHEFKELSIGMSGDYHLAIKHGSTMVRIGTGIFGKRNY